LINHLRIPGGVPNEAGLRYLERVEATVKPYAPSPRLPLAADRCDRDGESSHRYQSIADTIVQLSAPRRACSLGASRDGKR